MDPALPRRGLAGEVKLMNVVEAVIQEQFRHKVTESARAHSYYGSTNKRM